MPPPDITDKINDQLNDLKSQLKTNIKKEENRGSSLKSLEKDSLCMLQTSIKFKKQAEKTKMQKMWELYKYVFLVGVLILLLLFPIIKLFL